MGRILSIYTKVSMAILQHLKGVTDSKHVSEHPICNSASLISDCIIEIVLYISLIAC